MPSWQRLYFLFQHFVGRLGIGGVLDKAASVEYVNPASRQYGSIFVVDSTVPTNLEIRFELFEV